MTEEHPTENLDLLNEIAQLKEQMLEVNEEQLNVAVIVEEENTNQDIQDLDKSIQKVKKPRTEKQKQALIKAQETRKKNLIRKKQEKEEALKNPQPEPEPQPKIVRKKKQPKVVYEEDPSSDEEVIIMKKRPKKKKKKIVYIEPSSDEGSTSEEEIIKEIQKPKRGYKKKVSLNVPDSDSEDEAYEYEYSVQQPLKYADVFKFS